MFPDYALGLFFDFFVGKPIVIGPIQAALIIVGVIVSGLLLSLFKALKRDILGNDHFKMTFTLLNDFIFQEIIFFIGFLFILGGLNYSIFIDGSISFTNHSIFFSVIGVLLLTLGVIIKKKFPSLSSNIKNSSSTKPDKLKYRPEIDGLRAVAVIPVILYHLKVKGFEGGYVGVDVFFVISGFLITSIIFREIQNGSFSIANFYERRIRRIFPALFIVLFFLFITGYWLFDEITFKSMSESIISTTFFTSNFMLWKQIGYFDTPAELKPLLHMWSLAVEEQFYIFFPLFFMFTWRFFKKNFKAVLIVLATVSFFLSQVWLSKDASADFYLLPFRAWELLLGSILAIGTLPSIKQKFINNFLGFLGLALILFAIFTFTSSTPFPGVAALAPTFGAFLIIYATTEGDRVIGSVLSWQPLVFIGKISYSLYLWHWVLIVLARYYNILPLSNMQNYLLISAIFLISTLAWKFIEIPFRDKKTYDRNFVFTFGLVITLVFGLVGFVFFENDSLPWRNTDPLPNYFWSSLLYGPDDNLSKCLTNLYWQEHFDTENAQNNYNFCDIGLIDAPVSFVLFGDSHVLGPSFIINEISKSFKVHGIVLYQPGCPPLIEVDVDQTANCENNNQQKLKYILNQPDLKTVFLFGRWQIYSNGTRYKNEKGNDIKISYLDNSKSDNYSNILEYGTNNIISELEKHGKLVVFVNDIPEVGYSVFETTSIAKRTNRNINQIIAPTFDEFSERYQPVFSMVDHLIEKHPNLIVIDLFEDFCNETHCIVEKDGYPLYVDYDHLNYYGALLIKHRFEEIFSKIEY
ncbi:MAG: acyltransferase family protein [Anaerolineaceae bacterium]|nr:acyltransferase family protein [Anaerolineaceae bacterium]